MNIEIVYDILSSEFFEFIESVRITSASVNEPFYQKSGFKYKLYVITGIYSWIKIRIFKFDKILFYAIIFIKKRGKNIII